MKHWILVSLFIVVAFALLYVLKVWPRGYEGFQVMGPLTDPSIDMMAIEEEKSDLMRKITEIRTALQVIEASRKKQEDTLEKVLGAEELNKLDYITGELAFFKGGSDGLQTVKDAIGKFHTASEEDKQNIRMMILTGHQQAQLLVYALSTIPSMIIASNTVVDTADANADTIGDPNVVAKTTGPLLSFLSSLPSPSDEYKKAEDAVLAALKGATTQKTPDALEGFMKAFDTYSKIAENLIFVYEQALRRMEMKRDKAIAHVGISAANANQPGMTADGLNLSSPVLQGALDALQGARKAMERELSGVVRTLNTIKNTVAEYSRTFPDNLKLNEMKLRVEEMYRNYNAKAQNIATQIAEVPAQPSAETVKAQETALPPLDTGANIPMDILKESFVSKGNPYSSPSPNIQQAYEFRLGKRELVDAVMQVAR